MTANYLHFTYKVDDHGNGHEWLKRITTAVREQLKPEEINPSFLPVARWVKHLKWDWQGSDGVEPSADIFVVTPQPVLWTYAGPVFNDYFRRTGTWPDGAIVVVAIFNEDSPEQPELPRAQTGRCGVHLFTPIKTVMDSITEAANRVADQLERISRERKITSVTLPTQRKPEPASNVPQEHSGRRSHRASLRRGDHLRG